MRVYVNRQASSVGIRPPAPHLPRERAYTNMTSKNLFTSPVLNRSDFLQTQYLYLPFLFSSMLFQHLGKHQVQKRERSVLKPPTIIGVFSLQTGRLNFPRRSQTYKYLQIGPHRKDLRIWLRHSHLSLLVIYHFSLQYFWYVRADNERQSEFESINIYLQTGVISYLGKCSK